VSRETVDGKRETTGQSLLPDIAKETGSLDPGEFRRCEGILDRLFAMTSGLIKRSDAK
jgi:hypothetical protein